MPQESNSNLSTGKESLDDFRESIVSEVLASINRIPSGVIIAWHGNAEDIPIGWAICDGKAKGVPDLRGRFLRGATLDTCGESGEGNKRTSTAEFKGYDTSTKYQAHAPGTMDFTKPSHVHEFDPIPPYLNVVYLIKL